MKTTDKFKEYIWLLNTIRRARRITFEEINEKWVETDMSGGVELAKATFHRHKDAIQDIFGIFIECDCKNGYEYFIGNENVLHENTVQNWMLSTLSVNNIISESLSLQKRILLEPVSYEGDYLPKVIEAMKRNVRIAVKYRKYGDEAPRELTFDPYCLKMYRQRWYVLGHFMKKVENGEIIEYFGMFSFDRIEEMKLTDVKFQIDPDFDAQSYFHDCFGVLSGDGTEPERIVIRAFGFESYYLKDLPLHKSQREIGHGDNYTDFELFMRPTLDFSGHLLSRSNQIKLLSPQWLADEIYNMHINAALLYEPEED